MVVVVVVAAEVVVAVAVVTAVGGDAVGRWRSSGSLDRRGTSVWAVACAHLPGWE